MFRATLLAAFVAYASAQSLSEQCSNALAGIAVDPAAAQCLSVGSLLPLLSSSPSASIIPPINTWLGSLCNAAPCSNETIAAVVQNVTAGCETELSAVGLTAADVGGFTGLIQQYYPTVRNVICLKEGNTNCVTQTLTNFEGVYGTFAIDKIFDSISSPPEVPTNITCTNCIKAALQVVVKDVPAISSSANDAFQERCGADFVDGAAVAGIAQSANTAAPGTAAQPSDGAAISSKVIFSSDLMMGISASVLVFGSTVFAFLA